MKFARKIILHSPVSDEGRIHNFIEQCLHDDVLLIAVVGPGCEELEDLIDDIVVSDGANADRFIATSSHPDESYEDVVNMVECWELDRCDPYQEVRL